MYQVFDLPDNRLFYVYYNNFTIDFPQIIQYLDTYQ